MGMEIRRTTRYVHSSGDMVWGGDEDGWGGVELGAEHPRLAPQPLCPCTSLGTPAETPTQIATPWHPGPLQRPPQPDCNPLPPNSPPSSGDPESLAPSGDPARPGSSGLQLFFGGCARLILPKTRVPFLLPSLAHGVLGPAWAKPQAVTTPPARPSRAPRPAPAPAHLGPPADPPIRPGRRQPALH